MDIANASRDVKPEEAALVRRNTGLDPKDHKVGYDALAVYVHPDNPLESITFAELAGIYREDGTLVRWRQLGLTVPGCPSDEIVRVSRQSSSGTYDFFRERVLDTRDFKLGSRDLNGSKDVVELVATTPCAIGYSGMGYATPHVKMLRVARRAGERRIRRRSSRPRAAPTRSRDPLHMYTLRRAERTRCRPTSTGSCRRRASESCGKRVRAGATRRGGGTVRGAGDGCRRRTGAAAARAGHSGRWPPSGRSKRPIRLSGVSAIVFVLAIFFFVFREAAPVLFSD